MAQEHRLQNTAVILAGDGIQSNITCDIRIVHQAARTRGQNPQHRGEQTDFLQLGNGPYITLENRR